MHTESYQLMEQFADEYLRNWEPLKIADIGSYDVNGTYRPIFVEYPRWEYIGFDICEGPNVDIVIPEAGDWIGRGLFDVVISGQCVEHVRKPWEWIKQVASMGRVGATFCIIAPNTWVYHEHPIDCWRLWPEGMKALFDEAGLTTIQTFYKDNDTVGIAVKGGQCLVQTHP